ncbi:hypothetical protein JL720_3901 [Aureococcus anophagefferens]|nr:hypothetical protein JL720_3901 [Aureococcus anophagefferens]
MGRPSILVSQPHTSHAVAAGAAAAAGAAVVDPARYPIAPLRPNADTAAEALERSLAAFGAGEAERRRTRVGPTAPRGRRRAAPAPARQRRHGGATGAKACEARVVAARRAAAVLLVYVRAARREFPAAVLAKEAAKWHSRAAADDVKGRELRIEALEELREAARRPIEALIARAMAVVADAQEAVVRAPRGTHDVRVEAARGDLRLARAAFAECRAAERGAARPEPRAQRSSAARRRLGRRRDRGRVALKLQALQRRRSVQHLVGWRIRTAHGGARAGRATRSSADVRDGGDVGSASTEAPPRPAMPGRRCGPTSARRTAGLQANYADFAAAARGAGPRVLRVRRVGERPRGARARAGRRRRERRPPAAAARRAAAPRRRRRALSTGGAGATSASPRGRTASGTRAASRGVGDGTYDVVFSDGDFRAGVPAEEIAPRDDDGGDGGGAYLEGAPPDEWEEVATDDGDIYYWNTATGEAAWERPRVEDSSRSGSTSTSSAT